MQKFKNRIMLIFSLAVVAFYFTSDFSLIDIEKTAIIVCIGIDKQDENYAVTAQVAIPQATDQTASNDDATISGQGKTVFEAIEQISSKTGWHPKLSFCDLILLGEDVLKEDILPLVESFLKSPKIPSSALIATCQGKAKDILTAKTPLDAISAFAVQKILFKNPFKANDISNLDIKTFALLSNSASEYGFVPLIEKEEQDDEQKEGGSSSQTVSLPTASEGEGKKEKSAVFNATKTIIFKKGKMVTTLDPDETLIYNMLFKNVQETFIDVSSGSENFLLSISEAKKSISVDSENLTLNIKISMKAQEIDNNKSDQFFQNNEQMLVDYSHLEKCSNRVQEIIEKLFLKSQKTDCDFLQAKLILYKFHPKIYEKVKSTPLNDFKLNVTVTTKSVG